MLKEHWGAESCTYWAGEGMFRGARVTWSGGSSTAVWDGRCFSLLCQQLPEPRRAGHRQRRVGCGKTGSKRVPPALNWKYLAGNNLMVPRVRCLLDIWEGWIRLEWWLAQARETPKKKKKSPTKAPLSTTFTTMLLSVEKGTSLWIMGATWIWN